MYAVIQSGGKQYRVEPGKTVVVEKLDGDKGARDLIRDPDASIETIEIKEAALDIDTFDDQDRLKKLEHGS